MSTDYIKALKIFKTWGTPIPPSLKAKYRQQCKHLRLRDRVMEQWSPFGSAVDTPTEQNHRNCCCCNKPSDVRDLDWNPQLRAYLCKPCKEKIMDATESGVINGLSLLVAKHMYELEAEDTRKANSANVPTITPGVHCPRCGTAKSVTHLITRDTDEQVYFCHECKDSFGYLNGKIAWREGDHRFVRKLGRKPTEPDHVCDICRRTSNEFPLETWYELNMNEKDMTRDVLGIGYFFTYTYCEECVMNMSVEDQKKVHTFIKLPY